MTGNMIRQGGEILSSGFPGRLGCVTLFTILLVFNLSTEAIGVDWIMFHTGDTFDFYYDRNSIMYLDLNTYDRLIFEVSVKGIPKYSLVKDLQMMTRKRNQQSTDGYEYYAYSVFRYQVNCAARSAGPREGHDYDKQEGILGPANIYFTYPVFVIPEVGQLDAYFGEIQKDPATQELIEGFRSGQLSQVDLNHIVIGYLNEGRIKFDHPFLGWTARPFVPEGPAELELLIKKNGVRVQFSCLDVFR